MAQHKKFSGSSEEEVRRLYEEGNSAALIGRLMNADGQTVLDTLKRMGVPRRGPGGRRKFIPVEKLQQMTALYTQGWSCEKIAAELGLKWITVNLQLKRSGVDLRPGGFKEGEEHHCWSGGRLIRPDGYAQVLVHEDDPFYSMGQKKVGNRVRYALEHRLVMARHLGRLLTKDETVHHIDGNKGNNDISNLQLRHGKHGKGSCLRCKDCGSYNIEEAALSVN